MAYDATTPYELAILNVLDRKQAEKESLLNIVEWLKLLRKSAEKDNNTKAIDFISKVTSAVINTDIFLRNLREGKK